MMKKEKEYSLARKSGVVISILLGVASLAVLLVVFCYIRYRELIRTELLLLGCVLGVVIIGTGIYFYRGILVPYRKIKRILLQFNAGVSFDQFFTLKHSIYGGMVGTIRRVEEMLNREDAIQTSKKQAEYLALQNQINPHFLYNTLEAIRGDALSEGVTSIAQTTEALATFFRYTISKLENLVPLEDELSNVESYFIIQQYRFGEKLNMEMEYDKHDKKILQYLLPKLTLQPIIENAIFHGLECKTSPGTVKIKIQTTQSRMLINIIDDGVGMSQETLDKLNKRFTTPFTPADDTKKKGGIALVNVNHRIQLLFGEEYGLMVSSSINLGTDVEITLPLITEESDVNV